MKRQVIVLDVTYDDQDDGTVPRAEPARWDWTELLDASPQRARVEVVAAGPDTPVEMR